jgi:hypothetical protein
LLAWNSESGLIDASLEQTTVPTILQSVELLRLQEAIESFPPRSVASFLLNICTSYGTDSFFYFDQAQFLDDIDQFYMDPTSSLRYDASFICLALAAFALGAQRTPLVRPKDLIPGPCIEEGDPGHIFYQQARALIPDVIERTCLRSIQATFALGVYLLPQTAIGSSYVYIGIALRKAVAFDLHLNTVDPTLEQQETEARRRLWWSIYSVER